MPLRSETIASISQWFMKHSPLSHLVHQNAAALLDQNSAACFRWAVSGLMAGKTEPHAVFDDILFGGSVPALAQITTEIHNTFGVHGHQLVGSLTPATREARNRLRPVLHRLTAAVFRHCLASNGFDLTAQSNYLVCMEYECSPHQPMYPNFTHAWLAYRDAFVVQKVTGSYVSISLREAGRQPHCGLIRCPVADFLPEQIEVIEDMVANAAECNDISKLTVCAFPIGIETAVLPPTV